MPSPTHTVEIEFVDGAWTDVSAYVLAIGNIDTGRSSEFDADFRAGTATVTLSNIDRRFEPEFAASPYFPNVVPMRRIRIRFTWATVVYDAFTGFVERWPPVWQDPAEATVTVTAVDGFAVLALAGLPSSAWEVEVRADAPVAWWRLGESSGTTAIDSGPNRYHAAYVGGPTFNSRAGLVAKDPDGAIGFLAVDQRAEYTGAILSGYPFSVEAPVWMPTDATLATKQLVNSYYRTNSGPVVSLYVEGTGTYGRQIVFIVRDSAGVGRVVVGGVVDDDKIHHVVAVATSATDFKLYLDGVDVTVVVIAGSPVFPTPEVWGIGNIAYIGGYPCLATLDEVAIYSSALSPARITAHYGAGSNPWAGTSGARVNRVLDAIGWPAADRSVDTGQSVLQATGLGGFALAYLQAVARSEAGALYMTGDGKVRFRGRHAMLRAPYTVSQAIFGDGPGELAYSELTPSYDVDSIRNVVRRGRSGGSVQQASDAASITRYKGQRVDEMTDSMVVSDNETRDAADWVLAHRKDARLRIESMLLEPYGDEAAVFPQLLGRAIGDRITVRRRPPGGGAALDVDLHIEGISHRPGPDLHWTTTWRLGAASSTEYWALGTSLLGVGTRLAY